MKTNLMTKVRIGAVAPYRFKMLLMAGAVAGVTPLAAYAQTAPEVVVVTAQKRSENIQNVPISIVSLSTTLMDQEGVRTIDDISRLAPSLHFARTAGVAGNNGANISIRGIASDVGAATTAIYIDDTPIQIRSVGYFSGNPYPRIFDLDRVEVLRGPQGTLFGAGAEGGAVRFITPQPTFGPMKAYVRAEAGTTENGSPSGEVGAALGSKITDTLAFRGSVWLRRDGGYVDQVIPQTTTVVQKDINSQDTATARLAVTWKPISKLTLTPSIYFQRVKSGGRDQLWEQSSNLAGHNYAAAPTTSEPDEDRFFQSSLHAQYDVTDKISLVSNTSTFDRNDDKVVNYIAYQSFLRTGSEFGSFANKDPTNSNTYLHTGQKNLVQELRAQSYAPDNMFDWTVGLYYAETKQNFQNLTGSGRLPGVISSGFPQYLGRFNLLEIVAAQDDQAAAFASVDWKITSKLKATVGARYTRIQFGFSDLRNGPVNSGAQSLALANVTNYAFTPRFALQYNFDAHNMVYASASQGFRPGGAQLPVDPNFCAADLATLNIKASPTGYNSDSLWSYELGSKNTMGGVVLSADAYYVQWKNIQQAIRLPTCSFSYVDNLGSATGKGIDFQASYRPMDWLQVGVSLGYNHTTLDQTIKGGKGLILRTAGDKIGGPEWTGSLYGQGDWPVQTNVDGYLRADYTFQSVGVGVNSLDFGYDPGLPPLPASDYLALRLGVKFKSYDVSAFVNNVTDSNAPITRSDDGIGSKVYYRETYRPRTIGVTATYRY